MNSVLYDHQAFDLQKFGGVSRYFYELMSHIRTPYELPFSFTSNYYICNGGLDNKKVCVPSRMFKLFRKQFVALNRYYSERALQSSKCLYHPTYYNPYFLNFIGKSPYVITVHDMTHELMPQYFRDAANMVAWKKRVITNAARVIAVSENTKQDVVNLLGIAPEKVDVIYHGWSAMGKGTSSLILPERYLLYVGERGGYKNFVRFLQAFKILAEKDPSLVLICTGREVKKAEYNLFKSYNLHARIKVLSVNNEELGQLYRQALAFVYPSEYEGFGIPLLEAYANECPVSLSRASCFPEIAGEAGDYFDPLSVDDMAESIGRIIYNEAYRTSLVHRGRERLAAYSWDNTAKHTDFIYQTIL